MKHDLYRLVIKVKKSDSAFTYFQLEANEGICFYSTLEHKKIDTARSIEIFTPLCFKKNVLHVISRLKDIYPLEIIEELLIEDTNEK